MGKVKAKFSTRSILKKINKDNFEKKHVGKVKAKFSTSSILKKKFDKDNFKKQTYGETL